MYIDVVFEYWYSYTDTEMKEDHCTLLLYVNGKYVREFGDDYHHASSSVAEGYYKALVDLYGTDRYIQANTRGRSCTQESPWYATVPSKQYTLLEAIGDKS